MKIFKDAIKEINAELDKIFLFDAALNAIIVFLIAFLLLSFFNASAVYALIITLLYFVFAAYRKIREDKIRDMESKFDFLKEKLRTAAEHANVDNPVVDELHHEVLKELRTTEEAVFFNEKKTYIKAAVIALLCFMIIALAPIAFPKININLFSQNKVIITAAGGEEGPFKGEGKTGSLAPSKGSIYGTKSVAKLGSKELKVEIRPAGYELNIKEVSEVEKRKFNEQYPEEIYAEPSEAFEENIPKEQLELVKNYFKSVAEG
jgi:hypothetical protein